MNFKNEHNLELAIAVWLLYDDYDYSADPFTISATTLLQPTRSIILTVQHDLSDNVMDISRLIPSRVGSALHESLERWWKNPETLDKAFDALGLNKIRERIIVNPIHVMENEIPIYIENRTSKKLGRWTITGKYDIVMDGVVQDYKSTSVWAWVFKSNHTLYSQQGSIYKWLNPDKITEHYMKIHYIFTDWSKTKALQSNDYPQLRVQSAKYPLMSLHDTQVFIEQKLHALDSLLEADQDLLPLCTPTELWQKEPHFKYYKNPDAIATGKRSTKNFATLAEAEELFHEHGDVGKIVTVPGEVMRCKYCNAFSVCNQAKDMIAEGLIKID